MKGGIRDLMVSKTMKKKNYTVAPENPNLRLYEANQVVIKEGESDSNKVYILQEGRLEVLKNDNKVAEISQPGGIFGEISPILGVPRTATIKTLEPSEILVYEGTMEELIGDQPPIARMLIKTLAERLKQTTAELNEASKASKESQARIKKLEQINAELREKIESLQKEISKN